MPYCPACGLERTGDAPTCPLDGRYYRIERCPACGGERAPSEAFCIHCGAPMRAPRVEVVALAPAPLGRRALALAIDLVCLAYLAEAGPLAMGFDGAAWVAGPALFLLYFAVWTAGGRRTIGQQILGLAVLSDDRSPLPWARALTRSALLGLSLALAGVPLLLTARSGRLLHDGAARSRVYLS